MVSTANKCNKEIDGKEVTPRGKEMRKRAHEKLVKAADSVKKRIINEVGDNKLYEVGEIVHVPLKDLDKAKVDPGTLTGVIVQVDKACSQAGVAVKSGLLKSWYVYHRLGRVTGRSNNVELNRLTEALKNQKKMPVITEREAGREGRCNLQLQGTMRHRPMFLQEGWEDLLLRLSPEQFLMHQS
jgi:hypothetical protein